MSGSIYFASQCCKMMLDMYYVSEYNFCAKRGALSWLCEALPPLKLTAFSIHLADNMLASHAQFHDIYDGQNIHVYDY